MPTTQQNSENSENFKRHGWKELFAGLVGGSGKRGGDNIFKRGVGQKEGNQQFLQKLQGEVT